MKYFINHSQYPLHGHRSVQDNPAFLQLHFRLHDTLQLHFFSSLQATDAFGNVVHNGQRNSSFNTHPQCLTSTVEGTFDRQFIQMLLWYLALLVCCSSTLLVGGQLSIIRPFFTNNDLLHSLTLSKDDVLSYSKHTYLSRSLFSFSEISFIPGNDTNVSVTSG